MRYAYVFRVRQQKAGLCARFVIVLLVNLDFVHCVRKILNERPADAVFCAGLRAMRAKNLHGLRLFVRYQEHSQVPLMMLRVMINTLRAVRVQLSSDYYY